MAACVMPPSEVPTQPQTVKYVTSFGKVHWSNIKFAPKCTNKAKNSHHWGKNHTKENDHNKASNEKGVGLHIFKALVTPIGEKRVVIGCSRTYKHPP